MNLIRMIALRLMGLVVMAAVAACGDDVTNNYYQEPESPEPENPTLHEPGEWIQAVASPCFYGLGGASVLYPSWLLQAEGVRMYYGEKSSFVKEYVKSGLVMSLKNPGAGVRVTVQAAASDISRAFSTDYVVKEEEGDAEELMLDLPVDWNEEVLLNWDTDRLVKMNWTLLLDGQEVEKYVSTFNCRSLHCISGGFILLKSEEEDAELVKEFKKYEFGDYIVKENDEYLEIYNLPFLMGYIDENSPRIEKMKREVIDDGLESGLYSWGGGGSDYDLVHSSSIPFAYLMMKNRIAYTIRHASNIQYVRTIDAVFEDKQGYCMELALAFASWCMNMGVTCTVECMPGHIANRIKLNDRLYPVDMTLVASCWNGFANSTDPGIQELVNVWKPDGAIDLDLYKTCYGLFEGYWDRYNQAYEEERQAGNIDYATLYPDELRPYLPSFNVSQGYAKSRVASPSKEIQTLHGLAWKRLLEPEE
mgnify:CR=1 FL=1